MAVSTVIYHTEVFNLLSLFISLPLGQPFIRLEIAFLSLPLGGLLHAIFAPVLGYCSLLCSYVIVMAHGYSTKA
jgi:hypothetical protein